MYYNWEDKINTEELKEVCNLIRNGEIVIFPTETVYGIGANALDSNAIKKIFIAKGRPSDNPLIVHIADKSSIYDIAENVSEMEKVLIDAFMPGPFTIILKRKCIVPDIITAGLDTVAVRMPDNVIAKKIIQSSGVPIAAPSANISGKPSGTSIKDIKLELEDKVSAIIDGGDTQIGLESTVVKVVNEVPIILRPGKITPEDIEKVAGKVKIDSKVFKKVIENEEVESPGMKYKHYAPETKCVLVNYINDEEQVICLKKKIKEYSEDVVVIGFSEHKEKLNLPERKFIEIGTKKDLEKYAKEIYSALRKADKSKSKLILIEGVERKGLGIAIMNRLLRATSYDVLE